MLKKTNMWFVIICLLISFNAPVYAQQNRMMAERGCLVGLFAALLYCALARAPEGVSVSSRSNLGIGLISAYMFADMGLNIATSIMDSYAKKDDNNSDGKANDNFDAATALSAVSAGLLLMGTVGSIPEMMGPSFGTVFSFMALGTSVGGFVAYMTGYNKISGSTNSNQKSALVLNAVSIAANLVATAIHPVWAYYRRIHPQNSES